MGRQKFNIEMPVIIKPCYLPQERQLESYIICCLYSKELKAMEDDHYRLGVWQIKKGERQLPTLLLISETFLSIYLSLVTGLNK